LLRGERKREGEEGERIKCAEIIDFLFQRIHNALKIQLFSNFVFGSIAALAPDPLPTHKPLHRNPASTAQRGPDPTQTVVFGAL
jgi:hypothetical protein